MPRTSTEYKTRVDWVGKVIHWKLYKKWYMHNPESFPGKETHKLLWDFEIQTDHLISARWPDLVINYKKKENLANCELCCPSWSQSKIERKWKERKVLGPCWGIEKKLRNMKMTAIPIVIGALMTVTKGLVKGTGELRNKRTSGDHPNYSIIEVCQNTEKSSGVLRRFAVAQTPVRNDRLTLVWKTRKKSE